MKREKPKPSDKPHSHRTFPLVFWTDCCKCEKQFRWEWGFAFKLCYQEYYDYKYVCNECASTPEEADKIVKKEFDFK